MKLENSPKYGNYYRLTLNIRSKDHYVRIIKYLEKTYGCVSNPYLFATETRVLSELNGTDKPVVAVFRLYEKFINDRNISINNLSVYLSLL